MPDPNLVKSVFSAAVELTDPDAVRAYLERACQGDSDLRRRVEVLLRVRARPGPFLERPLVGRLPSSLAEELTGEGGHRSGPTSVFPDGGGMGAEPVSAGSYCNLQSAICNPVGLEFLQPPRRPEALGRLDHYEVLEVVGQGSMGLVLRVFDDQLQRIVAIKVLAPALAAVPNSRRRFLREARTAASIRHDHVVAIYAVADGEGLPYLVMEYIAGQTLQAKIDRQGPLRPEEILRIGLQVAEGLAAVHAHGLVHRDIKPANILLENGVERVKVADFGLARAVDDGSITQNGVIAGTPNYMSPEQANGLPLDHRSDLFSLGSVLHALATGVVPFYSRTLAGVLRKVCEEHLPPVREANPDAPAWLDAVIGRLHQKDAANRPKTTAEVVELLRACLVHLQNPSGPLPAGFDAAPPPAPVATPPPAPAAGRRGRAAAVAGLAVVLVTGALAAFWWEQRPTPTPSADAGTSPAPAWAVPVPVPTPEDLARLPAVADTLERKHIPADLLTRAGRSLAENAPPELVAILGGPEGHSWQLIALAVSPDGRLLATSGNDPYIKVWDLATGRLAQTLTLPGGGFPQIRDLAFSPDGTRLASSVTSRQIVLWDPKTGARLGALTGHSGMIRGLAFTREGRLLSTSEDATLRTWDLETKAQVQTRFTGVPITSLDLHPSEGILALCGYADDPKIHLWRLPPEQPGIALAGHEKYLYAVAFHPGGELLASAGQERSIRLWNLAAGREEGQLPGHGREGCMGLAWRGDGKLLASSGSRDGTLRLWDPFVRPPVCQAIPVTRPYSGPHVHAVRFTPEGRHVLVATEDGTAHVYRLARRGEVFRPVDHDRTAAAWVLSVGGEVTLDTAGVQQTRTPGEALPETPFAVARVRLGNVRSVADGDLERLSRLCLLEELELQGTGVTDAGLPLLTRLWGLQSLNLKGTPTTADGRLRLSAALPQCKFAVE